MANNPFLTIDQKMVGDIYTSPEVMQNLTTLCDDFGSRFGGSKGERQAAEFMQAKLIEYGLKNVHLEPVDYIGWTRGEVSLEIINPIQKSIPCITLPHSPPVDIEAVICDVEDGGPADFERHADEIAGKFAMVNSKTLPRAGCIAAKSMAALCWPVQAALSLSTTTLAMARPRAGSATTTKG